MTSGLQPVTSWEMMASANPVDFVLEKPVVDEPGKVFKYNSGTIHLLASLIKQKAGQEPLRYAETKLFNPLGISGVTWDADSKGVNVGGSGLSLSPLELAKFGYLYLRNGVWNGKQVVPKAWIRESTQKQVEANNGNEAENSGYGYLWWVNSFGGYSAHGFGGQYLFLIPEKDLVVVFTGGLPNSLFPVIIPSPFK